MQQGGIDPQLLPTHANTCSCQLIPPYYNSALAAEQ